MLLTKRTLAAGALLLVGGAGMWSDQASAQSPRHAVSPGANVSISATLTHLKPVHTVAYRPDGKMLATGDDLGLIWLWDLANGKPAVLDKLVGKGRVSSLTFAADGRLLATAHESDEPLCSSVCIWAVNNQRVLQTIPSKSLVCHVAFAPSGKRLALLDGRVVRLWDVNGGKEMERLPIEDENGPWRGARLAFSPDGRLLAVAGGRPRGADPKRQMQGAIKLWDLQRHRDLGRLDCNMVQAHDVAFSPDGRFLATTGWCERRRVIEEGREVVLLAPGSVELWELATRRRLAEYGGHSAAGWSVAFAPDGLMFATGAADQTVRLWRLGGDRELLVLKTTPERVRRLAFAPDGQALAVAGDDRRVDIWKMAPVPAPTSKPLSTEEARKAWAALADDDPARAYAAAVELASSAAQALALARQIRPAPIPDAQAVRALVAGLQSERFAERSRAARELEKLEEMAVAVLDEALAGQPPLDTRKRLEQLLVQAEGKPSPDTLRALRAVTVLHLLGDAEARSLLHEWTKGNPAARFTKAANSALQCLESRNVR